MRISVMGAGSIGGYFGGMLAHGGNDVSLVARGAHLDAINRDGLRVIRDNEEFTVRCQATDDPREIGPVELVLLTVKTYQNRQAVPEMRPMVGEATTVLCLQNGIDTYQDSARQLEPRRSGHRKADRQRRPDSVRRGGRQKVGTRRANLRGVDHVRHSRGAIIRR